MPHRILGEACETSNMTLSLSVELHLVLPLSISTAVVHYIFKANNYATCPVFSVRHAYQVADTSPIHCVFEFYSVLH